jgi:hypothetical protein
VCQSRIFAPLCWTISSSSSSCTRRIEEEVSSTSGRGEELEKDLVLINIPTLPLLVPALMAPLLLHKVSHVNVMPRRARRLRLRLKRFEKLSGVSGFARSRGAGGPPKSSVRRERVDESSDSPSDENVGPGARRHVLEERERTSTFSHGEVEKRSSTSPSKDCSSFSIIVLTLSMEVEGSEKRSRDDTKKQSSSKRRKTKYSASGKATKVRAT